MKAEILVDRTVGKENRGLRGETGVPRLVQADADDLLETLQDDPASGPFVVEAPGPFRIADAGHEERARSRRRVQGRILQFRRQFAAAVAHVELVAGGVPDIDGLGNRGTVALFRRRVPFLCAAGVVLNARGRHVKPRRCRLEGPCLALRKSGGGKRTGEPEEGERDLRRRRAERPLAAGDAAGRRSPRDRRRSRFPRASRSGPGAAAGRRDVAGPCHANMPPKATAL